MAEATKFLGDLVVTGTLTADSGVSTADLPLAAADVDAQGQEVIRLAVAGAQTTGTDKARALVGVDGTIVSIRAHLGTAPTTADFIIDVNKNGTTLFTTQANRPTIAMTTQASTSTAPDVTAVVATDVLTVDVDQIGSGVAGSDLTVVIVLKHALID